MIRRSTKRAIHPATSSKMHSNKRSIYSLRCRVHGGPNRGPNCKSISKFKHNQLLQPDRKKTIEGQSSLPLYYMQPWNNNRLQTLRKLLLMRLQLNGSTKWPEPLYAHTSLNFVPIYFCLEIITLVQQNEKIIITSRQTYSI